MEMPLLPCCTVMTRLQAACEKLMLLILRVRFLCLGSPCLVGLRLRPGSSLSLVPLLLRFLAPSLALLGLGRVPLGSGLWLLGCFCGFGAVFYLSPLFLVPSCFA